MVWWDRETGDGEFRDSLMTVLIEVLNNQRILMGDLSVLNTTIASLTAATAANTAAVADVTVVVSGLRNSSDQTAIDAANTAVNDIMTQINTNTAALEALKPVVTPPST
jgi:uncharacterized protein (DUF2141 family)